MDKFIKPVDLLSELCTITSSAEKYLYIVCPFAELHHHFKRSLKVHIKNEKVKIIFLYGKFSNKDHYSLNEKDFEFLKSFPNIEILYNERLHAKFYANEKTALVTTLNLNHSSSNNNIEYGILLNGESNPMANDIKIFINVIIEESEIKYINVPAEVPNENKKSGNERMESIKSEFPKAYERWTIEDDEKLEQYYCQGKSIAELSDEFKRQKSAIQSRINKLELPEKYHL